MELNVNKSFCLGFGPKFDSDVVELVSFHVESFENCDNVFSVGDELLGDENRTLWNSVGQWDYP